MLPVSFIPGPSQLYFTVQDHIRQAFREGVPSLSHRDKAFENIFRHATDGLRELLNIPTGHHVFFLGSATEAFERIAENLVENHSLHLVNGAFSKRFYETALQLNKKPFALDVQEGTGFDENISVPEGTELIAVTQNETSTGVSIPPATVHRIKQLHPHALLAVDGVSSLPYAHFDYTLVDTAFFSVQKGFGLPAGLGVWIVNEACIEKSNQLLSKGISTGSYHSLNSLLAHAQKNQTPETPNVLAIYLLGKITEDFLRRGIQTLRRETEYKAAILYQALQAHPVLAPFVKEPAHQSKTVIVMDSGKDTGRLQSFLLEKGLMAGEGYGAFKKSQLRFANFPAHSKEQVERLVDSLADFR